MRSPGTVMRVLREQERVERKAIKRKPALRNRKLKMRELPGWPDATKNQKRLRFQDQIGMIRPKR